MTIGIDISQLAYENSGVGNYLFKLLQSILEIDKKNSYVLFFSSFRQSVPHRVLALIKAYPNAKLRSKKYPPFLLDILWNKLHIMPVETLIGDVDIFLSSDWTQPPTKRAKKVTILYDLIVYKYPEESHEKISVNLAKLLVKPNIVAVQKRRLYWVKKECDKILCISRATKNDAMSILNIQEEKLKVIYPGV